MKFSSISRVFTVVLALGAFGSLPLQAQEGLAASPADSTGTRGFDASSFSMQKRWRPANAYQFRSDRLLDNVFVSAYLQGCSTFRTNYSDGPAAGISAGKWFNPYHAARVSLDFGRYNANYDAAKVTHFDFRASYMFNFVSYLYGYDPTRFFEASAVAGAGLSYVGRSGAGGFPLSAHLGVNATFRILGRFSLFMEPLFEIEGEALKLRRDDAWRGYVPAFNFKAGVTYNFFNRNVPADSYAAPFCYFVSVGGQLPSSATVLQSGSAMSATGLHFNAGVGFDCLDFLQLRPSVFASGCLWDTDVSMVRKTSFYAGVRGEALLDLVALISGERKRFGCSVLAGPEFGFFVKKDVEVTIGSLYAGLVGGVQCKYRLGERFSVFVEPRFSYVPYSTYTDDLSTVNDYRNYYDSLLSFSLGVEYRR